MRYRVTRAALIVAAFFVPAFSHAQPSKKPNILIIMADDYGFADCSIHGAKDIPTPNIDAIAKNGVRCTQGYVSAPQCSPTRAGLLTGRYQQRFGHDYNTAIENSNLSLKETTLADRLKAAGYVTGLVGKWHLGMDEKYHPQDRGFMEFFGFLGGANPYLPKGAKGVVPRILRGKEEANEKGFLTAAFGREAISFLERHQKEPFFLYLAFNAPHGPLEAPESYLKRFAGIKDEKRRTYAAMVSAMDDAIGQVLAKLRELGLENDTLIFFFSDNGGPTDVNGSSNFPFVGVKGELREGGIRTPFFIQWKAKLPAGQYPHPVIQLDIHPTVLSAVGAPATTGAKLDGVDLLPHLLGKKSGPPHEVLYWRFPFPRNQPTRHKWAIRVGDWKLYTDISTNRSKEERIIKNGNLKLINVVEDPAETKDLSKQYPEKAKEMHEMWKRWNAQMVPPPPPRKEATNSGFTRPSPANSGAGILSAFHGSTYSHRRRP